MGTVRVNGRMDWLMLDSAVSQAFKVSHRIYNPNKIIFQCGVNAGFILFFYIIYVQISIFILYFHYTDHDAFSHVCSYLDFLFITGVHSQG